MRVFRWDIFVDFYIKILPYISVTVTYVIASVFFGVCIGTGIAAMRLSKHMLLRGIASAYVTILRCVPSVVLLFLIYYGLPLFLEQYFGVLFGDEDTIIYVIVTFSLFLGASTSEIIRTSYLSVPEGQYEAAVLAGLSGFQAIRRIIFPQAFLVALPNLGNIFIFMMKEGALAYTIGLHDILGRGYYLNGLKANVFSQETYLALAFIYWPCTLLLEKIFSLWEGHMQRKQGKQWTKAGRRRLRRKGRVMG